MVQVVVPPANTFPPGVYRVSVHLDNDGGWEVLLANSDDTIVAAHGLDYGTATMVMRSLLNKFQPKDFFPQTDKIGRIKAIREHYGPAFGLKAAKQLHESGLILTGDLVRDFSRLCERLPPNFQV